MGKKKLPISVLLLIGGYENEIYDDKRVKWLKRSILDLKEQSNDPLEILVSINKNIYNNKIVKELIDTNFTHSNIFISNFYRSPLLNFECLIQRATQKYICFWTDHDLHNSNFLKDLYHVISSNQVSHVAPIFSGVPANDDEIKDSHEKILSTIDTSKIGKVKSFKMCVNSYIMGSIYGIWEKNIFKNIDMVGNEKFDFLLVIASSLEKGFIFFEPSKNLFGLRNLGTKRVKYHKTILPSNIFSSEIYFKTNFHRFYISILRIIENSCLTNSEKSICILILEKSLKGRNNFFGISKIGTRLLIKEFILLITFKANLHEFLFLLSYSIYANFLKKKLKLLTNKN